MDNGKKVIAKHAVATGLMDLKGSKHPRAKLTEQQVIEMRILHKGGYTSLDLAKVYKMNARHIRDIIAYRLWKTC
jgi:hypothetical protein